MAGQSRRRFLKALGLGTAAVITPKALWPAPQRRPNFIFILIDDLGWMDTTVYGSQYYETPNIERLAKRSMLFTDAYAANPLCSPTRASILTGKYPARLGITLPAGHLPPLPHDHPLLPAQGPAYHPVLTPESRRHLPLEEYTLAEALRDAGYRTAFVGKWHLGQPEEYWPPAQGFEINIGGGGYPSPPSYFSPYKIKPLPDGPPGEYITDRLTDETIKLLDTFRQEPFFICLWHYAVHAPYQAKEALVATFAGKRDPRGMQNNPTMAAMIKSMDESIGRVLDALDSLGLSDNTVIFFSSDNGGNEYDRVGPEQWPPTNNDPLRSGKASIYEGGVRVPLLVSWPGVVKPGSKCSEVVSSIDFYPTILQMAGIEPKKDQIIDGESIVPLLKSTGKLRREAIFCHFPHATRAPSGLICQPCTSVRKGDWKLIRFYATSEEFPNRYELYNLREDIGETNNLAEARPDLVKELDALIEDFLARTGALVPRPNPAYDPKALPVADGWRPSGDCKLTREEGRLCVHSTGGDPHIWTSDVPQASGHLLAIFRMRSSSSGVGQFFWADAKTPKFGPSVRLDFVPVHDGQWHEYQVSFTTDGPLKQIRIDPSTAPGRIEIDWVKLCSQDGTVLKTWDF
jgi:arylsulfatase A-like enzyme